MARIFPDLTPGSAPFSFLPRNIERWRHKEKNVSAIFIAQAILVKTDFLEMKARQSRYRWIRKRLFPLPQQFFMS